MNVITAVCVCMPRKVVKQPAVRPTIIRTPPTEAARAGEAQDDNSRDIVDSWYSWLPERGYYAIYRLER